VLVGAQVVDDLSLGGVVDHGGVEAAAGEGADEGDGLAAVGVGVRVVLDGERQVRAGVGGEDVAAAAQGEERADDGARVPDPVHHAGADAGLS
jgi:hypothetical protein